MKKQADRTINERLQEAQKMVESTASELKQAETDLSKVDDSDGDLDAVVDARLRLEAKIKVLNRRLEVATTTRDELQGDLALEQAADMAKTYEAAKRALEREEAASEKQMEELVGIPISDIDIHQQGTVRAASRFFRGARLAREQFEAAKVEHTAAEMRTSQLRTKRSRAESQARNALQNAVFEGRI